MNIFLRHLKDIEHWELEQRQARARGREECTEHVFPQRLSTIWSRFRFRKGVRGKREALAGGGEREVRIGGSAAQAGKGEAEHETGNSERLQWQRLCFRFN